MLTIIRALLAVLITLASLAYGVALLVTVGPAPAMVATMLGAIVSALIMPDV